YTHLPRSRAWNGWRLRPSSPSTRCASCSPSCSKPAPSASSSSRSTKSSARCLPMKTLRTETRNGVGSIILTRAAEYNTITPELRDELAAAIDRADADRDVHVILLRADGPALCADLIIAAESASFGYPPSRVWGTPTTAMWVYRMGLERAKRYLLTGDEIPALEAARIGLILEAVPDGELDVRATALAERMAQVPTNQL